MAFQDIRLPDEAEQGAFAVTPDFAVEKVRLKSGYSRAVLLRSKPIRSWSIAFGAQNLVGALSDEGLLALYNFYMSRGGQFNSFRFRDWLDYQLSQEVIATGNDIEYQFQIKKTYSDFGGFIRSEVISKPSNHADDPAYTIRVNAVSQTESVDYSIDYTSGYLTFLAAGSNVSLTNASMVIPTAFTRRITHDVGDITTGINVNDYVKISGFVDSDNLIPAAEAWQVTAKVAGQIDFTLIVSSGLNRDLSLGVAEGPVVSGVTLNRMTPIPNTQDVDATGYFDRHVSFDKNVKFDLEWAQVGRIKKVTLIEEP